MIQFEGREWGTATEIAARLGRDVTAAMVRNWGQRDGLLRVRMIGDDGRPEVRHPLDQAATIERDKRLAKRGRPRRLDTTPVAA